MENESKVVKNNWEIICPHCSEPIVVSLQGMSQVVKWALKKEDLDKIREDFIEKLNNIDGLPEKTKKEIIDYASSYENALGPEETELYIQQIKRDLNDNSED